jgi:short-subunit dehydrogenase
MTSKGTAVITGASAGIGAVYADRLAKRGYDLILVARRADRLKRIADVLKRQTSVSARTFAADLTNAADLAEVEALLRTDTSIAILVNNAGVGSTAPLLSADITEMERIIALNITAATRLAYAAAPAFVERGTGTIINIASGVAIAPEILNGVYGGSKAFLLALSQSLRHELASRGLRIQAVLPGATGTDFWDIAGTPVNQLPEAIVMSAEDVVDAALAGLDQGEFVTIPSLPSAADWEAFENARRALMPNLSLATPAGRYGKASPN